MKLINRRDFMYSMRNIVGECRSDKNGMLDCPYVTIRNLEYALNYKDKPYLLELFDCIEENYEKYHKDDVNKAYYMFKAIQLFKDYGRYAKELTPEAASILVSESPIEFNDPNNLNKIRALADEDFLSLARHAYPDMLPSEFISTYLKNFNKKHYRNVTDEKIDNFKSEQYNKMEEEGINYFNAASYSDEGRKTK